jgi:hypothetical protein
MLSMHVTRGRLHEITENGILWPLVLPNEMCVIIP